MGNWGGPFERNLVFVLLDIRDKPNTTLCVSFWLPSHLVNQADPCGEYPLTVHHRMKNNPASFRFATLEKQGAKP